MRFEAVPTGRDDVALLGFTSGTTGEPKATMHFHRDLLIIADGYAKEVLGVTPDDVFVGSPPLAFTFGLGGLAIFPLRFGATATLLENASPANMVEIIETYKATICFTAPTAYRAMMAAMDEGADLSSLRVAVSAGETLPGAGVRRVDAARPARRSSTASARPKCCTSSSPIASATRTPAATGTPVAGYEAQIVDEEMARCRAGTVGRLAVRGPTGCRYLADARQKRIRPRRLEPDRRRVHRRTSEGRFHFAARTDDMIISAGYNIAGPEVEAALLAHADVAECAVVGVPDDERGQIVAAFVVLRAGVAARRRRWRSGCRTTSRRRSRPYKYPRAVTFVDRLAEDRDRQDPAFRIRER